jgi:hypothetical protein
VQFARYAGRVRRSSSRVELQGIALIRKCSARVIQPCVFAEGHRPLICLYCPQANLDHAVATSTSTATTALLTAVALPCRSPSHVQQRASLQLRSISATSRPFAPPSSIVYSWWGILGSGSDDRVSQQLLQVCWRLFHQENKLLGRFW